jgi:hypothetical protein
VEIEHNKRDPTIHMDTCLQETLAVTGQVPGVSNKFSQAKASADATQDYVQAGGLSMPESSDAVLQKLNGSFASMAKLQFASLWVR